MLALRVWDLAQAYHCTAADVLRWPPEDLAINDAVLEAAKAKELDAMEKSGGKVQLVYDLRR